MFDDDIPLPNEDWGVESQPQNNKQPQKQEVQPLQKDSLPEAPASQSWTVVSPSGFNIILTHRFHTVQESFKALKVVENQLNALGFKPAQGKSYGGSGSQNSNENKSSKPTFKQINLIERLQREGLIDFSIDPKSLSFEEAKNLISGAVKK